MSSNINISPHKPRNMHQHSLEDFLNDFARKALDLSHSLRAPPSLPLIKSAFVSSQEFQLQDISESDRIFQGWGSIEMVDREGDFIPVDAIAEVMDTYMERGGVITDTHSSRIVGKMLDWDLRKREDGKKGIWLKGEIYRHYPVDDAVWYAIKTGHYQGFSLGGDAFEKYFECNDSECYQNIPKLALYEWSVVRTPANQGATIQAINAMAKSFNPEGHKKAFIEKSHLFLAYAQRKKLSRLLAEDVIEKCNICKQYVEDLVLVGLTKKTALKLLQHELDTILKYTTTKEETKPMSEQPIDEEIVEKQVPPQPPAAVPPGQGQGQGIQAMLQEIIKMLQQIVPQQPPAPAAPPPATTKADNPDSVKEPEEDDKEPEKGEDKKETIEKKQPQVIVDPAILQQTITEVLQKNFGIKKVSTPKPGIDVVHPADIKPEGAQDTTMMDLYKSITTGKIFDNEKAPGDRLTRALTTVEIERAKQEGRI